MDLDAHRDGVGSGTGFKEGEEGEGEVRDKGLEVVHGGVEVEVVGVEADGGTMLAGCGRRYWCPIKVCRVAGCGTLRRKRWRAEVPKPDHSRQPLPSR